MKNHLKRLLIGILVAVLLVQQTVVPLAADRTGTTIISTDSKEKAGTAKNTDQTKTEKKERKTAASALSSGSSVRKTAGISYGYSPAGTAVGREKNQEEKNLTQQGRTAAAVESSSGRENQDDTEEDEEPADSEAGQDGRDAGSHKEQGKETQDGAQGADQEKSTDDKKDTQHSSQDASAGEGKDKEESDVEEQPGETVSSGEESGQQPADDGKEETSDGQNQSSSRQESGQTSEPGSDGRKEGSAAAPGGQSGTFLPEQSEEEPVFDRYLNRNLLPAAAPRANNSVNMPAATYETFILQGKDGKGQKIAASGKVTMMVNRKAIQTDINQKHKDYISFTPHWGSSTTATLSTTSGSRNVSYYADDPKKAQHVGSIASPNMESRIVGGRVFKLESSMKNNLSCTYSNVGRYYDRSSGKSYAIDMKAVVVDFTKKPKGTEDVQAAIADGAVGEDGGPLFCFIGDRTIGVLTTFCDAVTVRYSFYIHGTQTPIQVRGFTRFGDVDAQQGIEFSKEADYFYAVNEANDYLGCSKGVYTSGNKAYIYALSSAAVENNPGSAFYTLFSGSQLTLRYTFAKCSRQDDGGEKNGADLKKYKVPFDNSDTKPYSSSSSSGYIHFDAKQPHLAEPEIQKYVFNGNNIQAETQTPHTAVSNVLPEVNSVYTYKIRTVCPYEDASDYHYDSWIIRDQVSPYLQVDQAVVYDGTGNRSSAFRIQTQAQGDGSTVVTATATNPAAQSFYEKNWYDLYITVRVKSQEQLDSLRLDFAGRYVRSGANTGRYVLTNRATLSTGTDYSSNEVQTVIPQRLIVRKVNEAGESVKGITFGIYTSANADVSREKPLMTAVTDDNGIARFSAVSFFDMAGKAGPYYVREMSRGSLENVYLLDEKWSYGFSSDGGNRVVYGETGDRSASTLEDVAKILKKYSVQIRKKNRETSKYLKGAVFGLYQWSAAGGSYRKVCNLEESVDETGEVFYRNPQDVTATEDNLGRFMVKEEQAPYGCYNAGVSWTFATTDAYVADNNKIEFLYTAESGRKKTQTGELIYENDLQKGILRLIKTDDAGDVVKGALFVIKAAEDIYAPWQYGEDGDVRPEQEPLVPKGMACGYLTTDADGSAESDPLYIGKYQVTEIGGAPDHVKGDEVYEVEFHYPEKDDMATVEETVQAGNVIMRPSLAVSKLADRTRNPEGGEVAFDADTGRYTEEKVPGVYQAGETIRFGIRVTNTGNTDLYHVRVYDSLDEVNTAGQKLADYVDVERASFALPASGSYETEQGDTIRASLSGEGGKMALLSRLKVSDSVTLWFEAPVLKEAANVYDLINKVTVTASYDNNEERPGQHLIPVNTEDLVDEEGNPLTEDEDRVHIPGTPDTTTVKLADRTTGGIVTDGEFNGVKVPGLYYEGDTVRFDIHIKNTGTANLKNILVTDVMSEELKQVIDADTAAFRLEDMAESAAEEPTDENRPETEEPVPESEKESERTDADATGESDSEEDSEKEEDNSDNEQEETDSGEEGRVTLLTGDGEKISARQLEPSRVILAENVDDVTGEGSLRPGDTVVLHFYAKVKKDAANFYDLLNTVIVNASYFTGEKDESVPEKTDTDLIELPGVPEAKVAKIADRTTGAVLADGRYQNEKIIGSYDNGDTIIFTITVTNSGTADLYDLKVRDVMEERLLSALEKDSIRFQDGQYSTTAGDTISTSLESGTVLLMDHLKAGDSVNLLLHAKVNQQAGDLFRLENKVYVTGHYRKGNEQYQLQYEEEAEMAGHSYLLEYHANNGTTEKTSDSETPAHQGEDVRIGGNPFTYEGHDFLGWNTKADGTGQDFAPGASYTMPAQDVHLYARWGSKGSVLKKNYTYALTYHSNNPLSQSRPDSETRCGAGTAVLLDENIFVYDGYCFLGWSMTPEAEDELLQPGDTYRMPKKDVHLYAQWEKEERVVLTYHSNIPGKERTKADFQTPCAIGTEITVKGCDFERKDYVFAGWSTDQKGTQPEIQPQTPLTLEKDTDLYAVWQREEDGKEQMRYQLTYHGNNETDDSFVDSQTPCADKTELVLANNLFVYNGYTFLGWNTKADGTGKMWECGASYTMPNRHVHLYAQWQKVEEHTLTYLSNYPNKEENVPDEQKMDSETPCAQQSVIRIDGCSFQCDGYQFAGWSLTPDGSGERILPEVQYTVSADTVLYAVWSNDCEEYRLLYSSNTEASLWEAAPASPAPAGTPHTLIGNPFSNAEASFVGWSLKADARPGSGDILQPGQRLEQPAEDTVLYAIWEKTESRRLCYDGNGGTTDAETQDDGRIVDEETPCIAGTGVRINPSAFHRDGFRFLGWSTKKLEPLKASSGTQVSDAASDDGTKGAQTWEQAAENADILYPGCAFAMPDQDLILYAVWEELPKTTFGEDMSGTEGSELADSPYTPIPVTELMKDQDHLNIPGEPELRVAKKADKTKGIKLKEGRYQGKRKAGVYYEGDRVIYSITVSNYGTGSAEQVAIKELPSAAWERALEAEGFTASVGEVLQSANGSQIHVQEKTKDTLTLDRLEPKDSVTVTYEAIVKARQVGTASLKNTVKVTGQKYDGTPIAETKYMKDSDTIQVTGEEPASEPGTGTNSVPKTGDETPLIPWLLIGLASLTAAAVILLVRQRRRR